MAVPIYTLALNNSGQQTLIPSGTLIGSLTVLSMPAGLLLIASTGGQGGAPIPLYRTGQVVRFCGGSEDGLTITVPAGITGVLQVALNLEIQTDDASSAAPASFLGGSIGTSAGNAAGQYSCTQLVNPANSGKCLIVQAAGITITVGALLTLRVVSVLQVGAVTSSYVTPTSPGMPATVSTFKAGNAIVGPNTPAGFLNVFGGTSLKAVLDKLPRPLVVPPGNAVETAGSLGVNGANLITALAWDEA